MSESIEATLELVPSGSLEAITRGEVDIQIATAHRYPRSMTTFRKRAVEMATLDEETAASCIYSRPVGGGKFAEGMSIRMAEIVGACYGNLRVGAMVIEQTERYVKARGFAHDLESNFACSSEVIESTVKRDGRPYDERMRVVIAKAAISKALRDATFRVVPKALAKPVETAARKAALGDASTIASRRDAVMGWVGKLGIDKARVFAALKIEGEDDIGLDELGTLTGLRTAIKDGEVTVDEAFPALVEPEEAPKLNRSTEKAAPKTEPKPAATEEKQAPLPVAAPHAFAATEEPEPARSLRRDIVTHCGSLDPNTVLAAAVDAQLMKLPRKGIRFAQLDEAGLATFGGVLPQALAAMKDGGGK